MILVAHRTRPVCDIAPTSTRTSRDDGFGCCVSPAEGEIRNSYSAVSSSGVFDMTAVSAGREREADGRQMDLALL